ncbi:MAG: T9SS type A sorting domain-containing protein, partial [Bacteroidales bacterium]|nr:T9SS type A sorting domain-containing protein [Bacteroidales bacterium]
SVTAQTKVQIIESRTLASPTTHKQFIEQKRDVFLAPKDFGTLGDKPVHKANYEYYGQVSNIQYAAENLGAHPDYVPSSTDGPGRKSGQFSELFPDSLLANYQIDVSSPTSQYNLKLDAFASTGFVFDPYSLDFDKFTSEGLFRDIAGVGYGYRLDTLFTVVDYRLPHGYNPNSPDTLRFYISYYDMYINPDTAKSGNRGEYIYSTFSSGGNLLAPFIKYADPLPGEGPYATTPYASKNSTIEIDYILSDQDSVGVGLDQNWIAWRSIELPISGGFVVPAGACLSALAKYIPGYTYSNNDTLAVRYWNTTRPSGEQYINGTIYNNYLSIANWNYDTGSRAYLFDQTGYNGHLHETQRLRYKDTTGWGILTYHPGYYGKPVFFMSLSLGDDTIHISNTSSITQVANLISNIYPNPATTQLTIDLENAGDADATIYNMLGQVVLQETLTSMSNKINIATLNPGMYVVKLKQNGKVHTVKMSKK